MLPHPSLQPSDPRLREEVVSDLEPDDATTAQVHDQCAVAIGGVGVIDAIAGVVGRRSSHNVGSVRIRSLSRHLSDETQVCIRYARISSVRCVTMLSNVETLGKSQRERLENSHGTLCASW